MANLGISTASDILHLSLVHYMRGMALSQTTQDKPLLAWLQANKKKFSGGGGSSKQLSFPVQGAYIADSANLQGYSADESLDFNASANVLRGTATWKEVHFGLWINWTELKLDGISIVEDKDAKQKINDHAEVATRLTPILESRLDDFNESYSRLKNKMFWADGSADSDLVAGITSFLDNDPTTQTKMGLARNTYSWWRHRVALNIAPSTANSTLIKKINSELIQLRRFGGKPNKALCGSGFLDALRDELVAKGYFTQTGFSGEKATDLGIGGLHVSGMGKFEYDPTLDDMAMQKYCFLMDGRRITLKPMEAEEDKALYPVRPYNYLVFMQSVTWTGTLICTQMNANEVMSVA